MSDTVISPNMSLPVPIVGQDIGPQYAFDVNSCLNIVDVHDHSAGNGVQISQAGINITGDLSFNSNDATSLRSTRFASQSAVLAEAADLRCAYVVSNDLYFNDGLGNQIRITQSGAVAGTPGSISNLVSPASASYVAANQTFVWQSAANTAANMDGGSIILRPITAAAFGITISPPGGLGANYTVTLPSALPASQKFVTLDNSGNLSAPWAVDSTSLEINSNTLQIKDLGVSTTKIAASAVTTAKIADGNVTPIKQSTAQNNFSNISGSYSNSTTSYTDVTGLSITMTVAGNRPIFMGLKSNGTSNQLVQVSSSTNSSAGVVKFIQNAGIDSTVVEIPLSILAGGATSTTVTAPTTAFSIVFMPVSAGSITFRVQAKAVGASSTILMNSGLQLEIIEL